MRCVFLIGPAGVGKSTCGALLATELGFTFLDLDSEFNARVGNIAEFIAKNGYISYGRRNAELFDTLVGAQESDTVYAISSGFLLYEDLDPSLSRLAADLRKLGVSIVLFPSSSIDLATDIAVRRLLARRPGLDEEKERRKFRTRFEKYSQHGDIRIVSSDSPAVIARQAKDEYERFLALPRSGRSTARQ
jgi:shikimate kinase